jgi:serine/threonine-protein kinase
VTSELPLDIGRYTLVEKIGSGGMASVYLGRLTGAAGLHRTVAIKRLHPHLAENDQLRLMLLDEARITLRIRHPNVVPTLDVAQLEQELLIVMEYVVGVSLARLIERASEPPPPAIVATIVASVLHGLHAAHETCDDHGAPLGVVHRDVSPQNILVGADGTTRVLDFGIAKAAGRMHATRDGQAKGKLAYMAPEQLETMEVDARTDVFATGVVLWEALTHKRLFGDENEALMTAKVLRGVVPPPSSRVGGLDPRFDAICARALERKPAARYATAREMALELEACGIVPSSVVARYVEETCGDEVLRNRSARALRAARSAGASATEKDAAPILVPVEERPPTDGRAARRRAWGALVAVAAAAAGAVAVHASRGRGAEPAPVPVVVAPPRASSDAPPEAAPVAVTSSSAPSADASPIASPGPTGARRAAPSRAPPAPSAPKKCVVVPVTQPDGTLDFEQRCE